MMRLFFALCFAAFTAACGLRPLYGEVGADDGAVSVSQIDGRMGHRLRQELQRTLSTGLPGAGQGARLDIYLREGTRRLSLKQDAGVSRTTMSGDADYKLFSSEGELISSGRVTATSDFDRAASDFGDIALQTDARERLALLLSRRLTERLALDLTQTAEIEQEQINISASNPSIRAFGDDGENESDDDDLELIQSTDPN